MYQRQILVEQMQTVDKLEQEVQRLLDTEEIKTLKA